jgi:hypothetical protein
VAASVAVWRFMETVTRGMPPGFAAAVRTMVSVFSLVYGLAYPLLLLYFMTLPNVIAACRPEPPPALNA